MVKQKGADCLCELILVSLDRWGRAGRLLDHRAHGSDKAVKKQLCRGGNAPPLGRSPVARWCSSVSLLEDSPAWAARKLPSCRKTVMPVGPQPPAHPSVTRGRNCSSWARHWATVGWCMRLRSSCTKAACPHDHQWRGARPSEGRWKQQSWKLLGQIPSWDPNVSRSAGGSLAQRCPGFAYSFQALAKMSRILLQFWAEACSGELGREEVPQPPQGHTRACSPKESATSLQRGQKPSDGALGRVNLPAPGCWTSWRLPLAASPGVEAIKRASRALSTLADSSRCWHDGAKLELGPQAKPPGCKRPVPGWPMAGRSDRKDPVQGPWRVGLHPRPRSNQSRLKG